jgi:2-amino-4-hydroxy-6-hydroxymethyldihydropteridine diphosphokinase
LTLVYIGCGTNLGDRLENLHRAKDILAGQVALLRTSPVYETAPWGYLDQPPFLNLVFEARTDIQPLDLLAALKKIEMDMGRLPAVRYGPRLIDLDILFYGHETINLPGLAIPHPAMGQRAFVLVPLADLIPGFRHPVTGLLIKEMLAGLDTGSVIPYKDK